MNDKTYNGWTNYETWLANLWGDNDEGSHLYRKEMADRCWDEAVADKCFTRKEVATADLAKQLQAEYEEAMPENLPGLYMDMLRASTSEVNWHEIAKNLLEEKE